MRADECNPAKRKVTSKSILGTVIHCAQVLNRILSVLLWRTKKIWSVLGRGTAWRHPEHRRTGVGNDGAFGGLQEKEKDKEGLQVS